MLKEILILASELSITDGEFVFVGFESDFDALPIDLHNGWGRPYFAKEPSKSNLDHFAIIFCKEVDSSVKLTLYPKVYFPIPEISWKAQKYQVNIFSSAFWIKKTTYFASQKIQNKNFSVIS